MMLDESRNELEYAFKIGLLIKHPYKNLSYVRDKIGIDPDFVKVAGEIMTTKSGRILNGFNKINVWSRYRFVGRNREIFQSVEETVTAIYPYKDVFIDISKTGGNSLIILQLPGYENIGAELKFGMLQKIGEMRVGFGVEVFPNFK